MHNIGYPLHRENRGNGQKKIPCQGKHREFGNFAKTHGIRFAQVVNSLILKLKDILKFAANISKICFEAGYVYQVSFVYI